MALKVTLEMFLFLDDATSTGNRMSKREWNWYRNDDFHLLHVAGSDNAANNFMCAPLISLSRKWQSKREFMTEMSAFRSTPGRARGHENLRRKAMKRKIDKNYVSCLFAGNGEGVLCCFGFGIQASRIYPFLSHFTVSKLRREPERWLREEKS